MDTNPITVGAFIVFFIVLIVIIAITVLIIYLIRKGQRAGKETLAMLTQNPETLSGLTSLASKVFL